MTAAYFAPVPRCPLHSHMVYDRRAGLWACTGWEGEGCGYTSDQPDLDWTPPEPGSDGPETIELAGEWL